MRKRADILLSLGVVGILVMMIIPMHPVMLDMMLSLNIMLGLVILLVALYTLEPLQFSIFPGMLLILTLFRLAMNVASTRLILGEGYAGKVISAFGNFVVGGNVVVGFIVFLILVLINFIVITKGSGRVAEVAARFTLDAMPGKQMAIDADLNNGVIDEAEARLRREKISREADFYGAMDGASKFVRGDAIAGLIITGINLVGGLAVGMLQLGMSAADAGRTFSLLTIGDGLVNQIPSLIISVAAGIIVTRAGSRSHFGSDLMEQLLSNVRPLAIASVVLIFFGLMPGLPTVPFFVLALLAGILAFRNRRGEIEAEEQAEQQAKEEAAPRAERIEDYLNLDTMEIELGYSLIELVDKEQGGDLLGRITSLRRQVAQDLGLVVPPIRIRDDMSLRPEAYQIRIRGNMAGKGEIRPGWLLALTGEDNEHGLKGLDTKDPTFGLPALWIREAHRGEAERAGYAVVEPSAVLATHLETIVRQQAWRILGQQDVKKLLENLKPDHAAVVEELHPKVLGLAAIHKVLQKLLREGVPIRDLTTILETLSETGGQTKDADILCEYCRHALSGSITGTLKGEDGRIKAMTLHPELEQLLQAEMDGRGGSLHPEAFAAVVAEIAGWRDRLQAEGRVPAVIARPEIRSYLARLLEGPLRDLRVVSFSELSLDVELESVAAVGLPAETAAHGDEHPQGAAQVAL